MKAMIFPTRAEAEAARAAIDAAAGLPVVHGESDLTIAEAGRAAERIRARGVRTDHVLEILPREDGSRFALPIEDADAVEIDRETWRGAGRDRRAVLGEEG